MEGLSRRTWHMVQFSSSAQSCASSVLPRERLKKNCHKGPKTGEAVEVEEAEGRPGVSHH